MKKMLWLTGFILIAGIAVFGTVQTTIAEDDERSVKWDALPASVQQAFLAAFDGEQPGDVVAETEGGMTVYEAEEDDVEVEVGENGEVLEIETEIANSQLPEAVRQAIMQQYDGAKIKEAVKIQIMAYEVEIKVGDNTHELMYFGNGQQLSGEDDDDDDDGEDDD